MTMRVLFLGNNWVGWQVARWLRTQQDEIVGLVIHPEPRRRYGAEIIKSAGVAPANIFDGSRLADSEVLAAIESLKPDIGVSALFGYIVRPKFLALLPAGCVNIHPSYLPYNRGAHPNIWSIIEGTPAGVTLHYIDAGIDSGDIISQRAIEVTPTDTGETLYRRLERACVKLFSEIWPLLREGGAPRVPQHGASGTCHRSRDVERIDEIDLEATYKAKDLINLIRARTFPPFAGAYFRSNGSKVYLRLELEVSDETSQPK
jgi:methionyl-tRNA formyltransferase